MNPPIITIRETTPPYSIITGLNYFKLSLVGNELPVLNNEKSEIVSFRVYNNFAGASSIKDAINVSVTTWDGLGHTASMAVASFGWLHVYQSGWGSGSSGPAQYTHFLGTDTAVGGLMGYDFQYSSDGTPGSPVIATEGGNGCGFVEVETYIKPTHGSTGMTNDFVVSVTYEYI